MKRYSASKEINTLVRQLVRDGWLFQRGRSIPQPCGMSNRALKPERSAGIPQLSAGRTPGPAPCVSIAADEAAPCQ
jgi:hypothetical protein